VEIAFGARTILCREANANWMIPIISIFSLPCCSLPFEAFEKSEADRRREQMIS
jgi:hypothetical protein